MVKGIEAVAVGLVVFILAQKLIATLITGTDTGSVICERIVTLQGDLHRITRQIRGKLKNESSMLIAELNQRMNLGNCGETRWRGSEIRINYRSWYSPIRLERASQTKNSNTGSFTHSIRRNVRNTAPSYSNVCRITRQIRGKLNLATGKPITELNCRLKAGNCGETRWRDSTSNENVGVWYSPVLAKAMKFMGFSGTQNLPCRRSEKIMTSG